MRYVFPVVVVAIDAQTITNLIKLLIAGAKVNDPETPMSADPSLVDSLRSVQQVILIMRDALADFPGPAAEITELCFTDTPGGCQKE